MLSRPLTKVLAVLVVVCVSAGAGLDQALAMDSKSSSAATLTVRGGRLASPLVAGGLVQKGDQVHASFRLYGADGITGLSDATAASLNVAGRITIHVQQIGSATATSQAVTYSRTTHRFSTTIQTFAWVGGANYRVWYSVKAANGTLIAGRGVAVGVRLGA